MLSHEDGKMFVTSEIRKLFKCLTFQEMVNSGLKHESFLMIVSYISFGYFDDTAEPGYLEGRKQIFQTEGIWSELQAFGLASCSGVSCRGVSLLPP